MKKRILALSLLTLLGTTTVLLMHLWTSSWAVRNGFNRTIIVDKVTKIKTIPFKSERLYFAGWIGDKLYLGDAKSPFQLLEISDSSISVVNISNKVKVSVSNSRISIDAPHFQLVDLNRFNIYRGDVHSWGLTSHVHARRLFSEELLIGPKSIILRDLNRKQTQYILSKEAFDPYSRFEADNLIQKQIDGLFCTDGMLGFDRSSSLLTYIYFYRNQFIVSDTSLNLLHRANTIDTVSIADIKVASVASGGYRTIASPPKIVNRASFTGGGKLYVNSNLIADNEDKRLYRNSDVIDVYDVSTGKYHDSFYIPRTDDERLRHFYIRQNWLYVLSGNTLSVYALN